MTENLDTNVMYARGARCRVRGVGFLALVVVSGCLAGPPPIMLAPGGSTLPHVDDPILLDRLGADAAESSVAVRPSDPPVVVVANLEYFHDPSGLEDTTFDVVLHRSLDGGRAWTTARLPASTRAPFDPAGSYHDVGDPVLTYAPDGALYLSAVAAVGAWKDGVSTVLDAETVFVTRSTDDGATWSPAVFHETLPGAFGSVAGTNVVIAGLIQDKEWIAAGPDGVLHLVWTTFAETQTVLRYARSLDNGATWSGPRAIAASGAGRILTGGVLSAAAPGRVVVAAVDTPIVGVGADSGGRARVWTSDDGGASFVERSSPGPAAVSRFTSVAADSRDATTVWFAGVDGTRVYLTRSLDEGRSWSAPLRMGANRTGVQQQPALWVEASGRCRLTFYDAGWPGGERLVHAIVDDRGVAFEGAAGPPVAPGRYRRDYVGLAGTGGTSWATWVAGSEDAGTVLAVAALRA